MKISTPNAQGFMPSINAAPTTMGRFISLIVSKTSRFLITIGDLKYFIIHFCKSPTLTKFADFFLHWFFGLFLWHDIPLFYLYVGNRRFPSTLANFVGDEKRPAEAKLSA